MPNGLILLAVAVVAFIAGGVLVFARAVVPGIIVLVAGLAALVAVILTLARPQPTTVRVMPPPDVAPPPSPVATQPPPLAAPAPPRVVTPPPVAVPTAPMVPTFLPAPGPLFVGREQELETLVAALRHAHGTTAIAVIGPAGNGRHHLVAQAIEAHRAEGTFPDGYSWHAASELHGDQGLRQVLIEVLDRLGGPAVAMTSTLRMGEAAVADLVRGKRMLFWLDDIPTDFPLGRALTTLTARDAQGVGPALIISSREDWAMPEINEMLLEVPQLDEAFDLLREWMELGGRALNFEEYEAAKAICVNLSYLPLAVRLAAGYAAQSGAKLAKLAADLGSAVYPPGDVARTATKAVAFAESSLFPQPRRAFAALAVFETPTIALDLASTVAATVAGSTVAATQADLEAMVRLGLLEPDGDDDHPRIRLHPVVRAYARERLADLGPDVTSAARAALASVIRARRVGQPDDDVDFAWDATAFAPQS
jgi:hypothetical protein